MIRFSLLVIVCISSIKCVDFNINKPDWVKIDKGWPVYDKSFGNTQFFYVRDKRSDIDIKFTDGFIKAIATVDQDNAFRISFKYWAYSDEQGFDPQSLVDYPGFKDLFLERYKSLKGISWQHNEYILSYHQLSDFKIRINNGDEHTLIAFKDFRVEYESIDPKPRSMLEGDVHTDLTGDTKNTDCIRKLSDGWRKQGCFEPSAIFSDDDIKFGQIDNKTLVVTLNDVEKNYCFDMAYMATAQANLTVYFRSPYDVYRDEILRIKPVVQDKSTKFDKDHYQTSKLCLKDLIAMQWGDAEIAFSVERENDDDLFGLQFTITQDESRNLEKQTKYPYLNSMKESVWKSEWNLDSKISEFDTKDDQIVITASAESQFPASKHVFSKWFSYDKNLSEIDLRYSVEVRDQNDFNAFTLRPKLCDDLSHCVDFYTNKVEVTTDTNKYIRTYHANFQPFDHGKFVKLLFYTEYYRPIKDLPSQLMLKIQLLHFGHPCEPDKDMCNGRGYCKVDDDKLVNQIKCDCEYGFRGQYCELTDYCNTKMTINTDKDTSGSYYCEIKTTPQSKCEILDTDFRCTCDDKPTANQQAGDVPFTTTWDSRSKKCEKIVIVPKSWKLDDKDVSGKTIYTPTNGGNQLTFKFTNVNNHKDICIQFDYFSKESIPLGVSYNSRPILFDYYLAKGGASKFEICTGDFVYQAEESFDLILSTYMVQDQANFYIKSDTITYLKRAKKPMITNPISWSRDLDIANCIVKYQTEVIVKQGSKKSDLKITTNKIANNTNINLVIITDWISPNDNIPNSLNQFTIQNNGDSGKIEITKSIISSDSKADPQSLTPTDKEPHTTDLTFPKPALQVPFKVLINVKLNGNPNDDLAQFDLDLSDLIIGDGCVKDYCLNGGTCKSTKSSNMGEGTCTCTDNNAPPRCKDKIICTPEKIQDCKKYPAPLDSPKDSSCKEGSGKVQCTCMDKYFSYSGPANKETCVRQFSYKTNVETCHGDKCMVDNMNTQMSWSDNNIPDIVKSKDEMPFYYTTKANQKLIVSLPKVQRPDDYCLNIKYEIGQGYNLFVGVNDNKPIALKNYMRSKDETFKNEQVVCVSQLSKTFPDNSQLVITSDIKNNDLVAVHIKEAANPKPKIPEKTEWFTFSDDPHYQTVLDDQWSVKIPSQGAWSINSKKIIFTANNYGENQEAILMSNWLESYVPGMNLRFTLANHTAEFKYDLSFLMFNNQLERSKIEKIAKVYNKDKDNFFYTVEIPDLKANPSSFKVGLLFEYSIDKAKTTNAIVEMSDLDLGDPCIEEKLPTGKMCSDKAEYCERKSAVKGFECHCLKKVTGPHCETTDYCGSNWNDKSTAPFGGDTGDNYCKDNKFGLCHNLPNDRWQCDCGNDPHLYFDQDTFSCSIVPKCLTNSCGANQKCTEPTDKDKERICSCKQGYVNLGTIDKLDCQEYNPCEENHRKAWDNKLDPKACADKNECKNLGAGHYMCLCPQGKHPKNPGLDHDGNCDDDNKCYIFTTQCEQICVHNDGSCDCNKNNYDMDGTTKCKAHANIPCKELDGQQFCDNRNQPACKEGYKPLNKTIPCEPDNQYSNLIFQNFAHFCPGQKGVVVDGKWECDCPSGQHWDEKTWRCALNTICSEGSDGRKECDAINAMCLITDKLGYECQCPPYTVHEGTAINSTCVPVCEHPDKNGHTRDAKCLAKNAKCNPIIPDDDKFTENDYCICNPGYVKDKNSGDCIAKDKTRQFSLVFKMEGYSQKDTSQVFVNPNMETTIYTNNYNVISELAEERDKTKNLNKKVIEKFSNVVDDLLNYDILKYAKAILQPIFRSDYESLQVISCTKDDEHNCKFSIVVGQDTEPKDLPAEIKDTCKDIPDKGDLCFIKTKINMENFHGSISLYTDSVTVNILLNKKELASSGKLVDYDHCEDENNVCTLTQYSYCARKDNSTMYKCVCNDKYFTTSKITRNDFNIERPDKCERLSDKVLCGTFCSSAASFTTNGKCYLKEPSGKATKEGYKVDYDCVCQKPFKTTGTNGKDLQCIDVCEQQSCSNNGKCQSNKDTANGWQCVCDEGYYGEECKDEHSLSKGGWIAGIVVLAVLVVIVSGVAYMFARRSRSNSNDYSGRPMDDYSTSYRVPTGGAQARGQSNQGFHRD